MKINLFMVGKHDSILIQERVSEYEKRIKHYMSFFTHVVPASKEQNVVLFKEKEGAAILNKIEKNDYLILLDEKGEEYTSVMFADYISSLQQQNKTNVVFVIGGAYGFSDNVYKRANKKIALSKLTFPHQLVRVIFIEQLYRVCTILKGEKYHH